MRYVICTTMRHPRGYDAPAIPLDGLGGVRIRYFGFEGVCLVACPNSPDHLIGQPNVIVLPSDLGQTVGPQASALEALLDAARLPHENIPASAVWLVVLRRIVQTMKIFEAIGHRPGRILDSVDLGGNITTLPQAVRDRAQAVANRLNVTLTAGVTIAQALIALRNAVPDGETRFDLIGL